LGGVGLVSVIDWQAEARRYALPVAFLVLVTATVLVVRGALRHDSARPAPKGSAQIVVRQPQPIQAAGRIYVVQPGDTLGRIARRFQTTVAHLLELNPGVRPTSLHVGQRVRAS
jgi:Tfp pilus assembly protein FimV